MLDDCKEEPRDVLERHLVDIFGEVRTILCGVGQEKHGDAWMRRADAFDIMKARKHLRAFEYGEVIDEESELPTAAHVISRIVLPEVRRRLDALDQS